MLSPMEILKKNTLVRTLTFPPKLVLLKKWIVVREVLSRTAAQFSYRYTCYMHVFYVYTCILLIYSTLFSGSVGYTNIAPNDDPNTLIVLAKGARETVISWMTFTKSGPRAFSRPINPFFRDFIIQRLESAHLV